MKKVLMFLIAALLVFGAGLSNATMINVALDDGSFVDVENDWSLGGSLSAELSGDLDTLNFELADSESIPFDFFTFNVEDYRNDGWGGGLFSVNAGLSFMSPSLNAVNSGGGVWGSAFGYSAGAFFWDNPVQTFLLDDGNGFSVALSQGFTLVAGSSETITATVTNLGGAPAPVLEPSTILLMGVGLVGVVGVGRKRFAKKS
jgi:hypothetical protein